MQMTMVRLPIVASQTWMFVGIVDGHHQTQEKKENYKRGPIACGVDVTMKFLAYTGGIFSEKKLDIGINHEISVTGWGFDEESQKEYWIGRNSWGTYWGEYGFFRIEMHMNNLGIETSCFW